MKNEKNLLIDEIKAEAKWCGKDKYPAREEWRIEDNKLFEFAKKEGVLNYYYNRLTKDNKYHRDKTINELRAAYFLKEGCNCQIIKWQPDNGRNGHGEFLISLCDTEIFCEVKSPGYKGEIVREQGHKSIRLQQSKYIPNEGKAVDNSPCIMDTVKKAYEKFPNNMPTLLIIIDDFWVDCFDDASCIHRTLYRKQLPPPYVDNTPEGLFAGKDYERLGGVLFIKFDLVYSKGFVWKIHIACNESAKICLPNKLIKNIEATSQINSAKVGIYKINNGWLEKIGNNHLPR